MRNIFLNDRFFWGVTIAMVIFLASFVIKEVFYLAVLIAAVIFDYFLLFQKAIRLRCRRFLPKVFSLGDQNPINIELQNLSNVNLQVQIIDELPFDFQNRDFSLDLDLGAEERKKVLYKLRPVTRGSYSFGKIRVFRRRGMSFGSARAH